MYDISINDIKNIKDIKLNIYGWYPLTISYGLHKISEKNYLVWNVNGTRHTFVIPLRIVVENHQGEYYKHFELTLSTLRTDLIEWMNKGKIEEWMNYYYNEFKNFIT